jgi:hypothetical protein
MHSKNATETWFAGRNDPLADNGQKHPAKQSI